MIIKYKSVEIFGTINSFKTSQGIYIEILINKNNLKNIFLLYSFITIFLFLYNFFKNLKIKKIFFFYSLYF